MTTWLAALAVINNVTTMIVSLIGGAAAGALISGIWNSRIAKENRDHSEKIQHLTSELQRLQRERDTLFTALHEHRREAIRELNAKLWDFYMWLYKFRANAFGETASARSMSDEVIPRGDEIAHYFVKNRIYFNEATNNLIGSCLGAFQNVGQMISNHVMFGVRTEDKNVKGIQEINDRYNGVAMANYVAMQDDFRRLLGVKD